MPGDAIVNPEDLIRFVPALKAFDSELMQIQARMQMEFQHSDAEPAFGDGVSLVLDFCEQLRLSGAGMLGIVQP